MTVTLELRPELEEKLRRRALAKGQRLDGYLLDVIERDADAKRSLDEILAPFRAEVEASGITDAEFDAFIEEIRNEVHLKQNP